MTSASNIGAEVRLLRTPRLQELQIPYAVAWRRNATSKARRQGRKCHQRAYLSRGVMRGDCRQANP